MYTVTFEEEIQEAQPFQEKEIVEEEPEGYFKVYFVDRIESKYSKKISFYTSTQDRILSSRLDDHDQMYETQCSLSESDAYRLFPDNPLHMGFFLDRIFGNLQVTVLYCMLVG